MVHTELFYDKRKLNESIASKLKHAYDAADSLPMHANETTHYGFVLTEFN